MNALPNQRHRRNPKMDFPRASRWMLMVASVLALALAGCSSSSAAGTLAPASPIASTPAGTPSASIPVPASASPDDSGAAGDTIQLSAQGIQFSTKQLQAPAGQAFIIVFQNNDSGIAHNVDILDASNTSIFKAPTVMRAGQAAILVGGEDLDVAFADTIVSSLGTVRHVGPLESGACHKLVANSMRADVVLAAAELQVAGEQAGLQPEDVFWVLARLAPMLAARHDGIVENRHEPTLFALRDLRKDLDLALRLFEPSEIQTPMTAQARALVSAAASRYGDLDITAVEQPYRRADGRVIP